MLVKVCTKCGTKYDIYVDYLVDGYNNKKAHYYLLAQGIVYKGKMMGLSLYNCPCGTTMGIDEYEGSRDEFIKTLKHKKTTVTA